VLQLVAALVLLAGAILATLLGLLPTAIVAGAAIGAGWLVARAQGRDRRIP
jgi:hypothetical protein